MNDVLTSQLKGSLALMPKDPAPPTQVVRVKFVEPDELELHTQLAAEAKEQKRELGDHILLRLLDTNSK